MKKGSTSWKLRIVKTLMQGTQIDNYLIENFSSTEKISMPTLNKDTKPVVLVKYEFENLEKFSLDVSDCHDPDRIEKTTSF